MGHPARAVQLPAAGYEGLADDVERVTAWHGAPPSMLAALLRGDATNSPAQLAAIAWVFDATRSRLLLVRHRTFGWSCPGGHVEHGEDPAGRGRSRARRGDGAAPLPRRTPPDHASLAPAHRATTTARPTTTGSSATASRQPSTRCSCPNATRCPGTTSPRSPTRRPRTWRRSSPRWVTAVRDGGTGRPTTRRRIRRHRRRQWSSSRPRRARSTTSAATSRSFRFSRCDDRRRAAKASSSP